MLQSISRPIWQQITLLHTFIVVWRLLVPIAFVTAAIAGIVSREIKNPTVTIIICYLVIVLTIPNWANRKMVPPSQTPFLREVEIYTEYFEKGNSIFEESRIKREPKKMEIALHPPTKHIEFLKGEGQFVQLTQKQRLHEYVLVADNDVLILENTNYFPGWEVFVNGKSLPINYKNMNHLGKITFSLKKGVYFVAVKYEDTPVITFSKTISFLALFGGVVYLLRGVGINYKNR